MEIFGVKVEAITRILREIALIGLVSVVIYKLLTIQWNFDFTKLSATDLVALVLAVFAVGLSAAFYFAASNSSAKFYDNMHKFTKDTSVILGQLTEQLKSLDKRQQEVKESVEKRYLSDGGKQKEDVAKEQAKELKVNEVREDLKKSVESWLEKYQVDASEKERIRQELEEKEALLSESMRQLSDFRAEQKEELFRKLRSHLHFKMRRARDRNISTFDEVVEFLLKANPASRYKSDLVRAGIISDISCDSIDGLTDEGMDVMSELYNRVFDN